MTLPATLFGLPLEIAVFGGVIALILLASPFLLAMISPKARIQKRASRMKKRVTHSPVPKHQDKDEHHSLRKTEGDASLPMLSELVSHLQSIRILRDRLARAGTTISAERYIAYNILLFVGVACVFILASHIRPLIAIFLGITVGFGLPHFIIGFKARRRQKKFLLLFPDAIDLIVRGLRAGLPVAESIKMVAREIEAPVGTIFDHMTQKMALGIPLEKALYDTAKKYHITEFDFFVTSIVLQRETGGNLSEILANLSEALRQRLMMRMKIKAMSSEAKASMLIIGALPFMVIGALSVMSPTYLLPLLNDYRGNIALFIAGGMLFFGMFIMTRMTQFEI